MFLSDRFVYVDLQKTGTEAVFQWLKDLNFARRRLDKHGKPPPDVIDGPLVKFATVRDPWEYYISLWAYGVDDGRRSGPYKSLTTFRPHKGRSLRLAGYRGALSFLPALTVSLRENRAANRRLYSDANDPALFRAWMRKVMHPRYAALLSGAYYASGLHRYAGFYTYRYCNLYCRDERTLHSGRLRDLASLRAFEEANCYIDDFIQTARLTADFVALIERHGWADEETARAAIGEKDRVNTSRKGLTKAEHFYDAETADLVAERERLLIDRFGYRRPDV